MIIETGGYKQTWFSSTKYKEINLYSKTVYYFVLDREQYRKHGPTMICMNNSKYWIHNRQNHRNDGPAWISLNPDKIIKTFFFRNIRISEQEYWNK